MPAAFRSGPETPPQTRQRGPRRDALSASAAGVRRARHHAGRGAARKIQWPVGQVGRAGVHRVCVLGDEQRMAKGTPATVALTKAGVAFKLHEYDYDPNAARIGMQAAEALGVSPARLLKTLMAKAGGAVVCVLVPSDAEVSLKKLASAAGAQD